MRALVVHYHEIGLKGRNRRFFEEALARNLKRALRGTGYKRIRHLFGRILVEFCTDTGPYTQADREHALALIHDQAPHLEPPPSPVFHEAPKD